VGRTEQLLDLARRVDELEQAADMLKAQLADVIRWLKDLEAQAEPAVTAQRIRDEWDGM